MKKGKSSIVLFNRISLLVIFFFIFNLSADEIKTGTLIATYQTGQKGERLNRIRFWLKDENMKLQMYPKAANFVDDKELMSRTVVIEDLPSGKYTLQFLIPNKDGFFEDVKPRELIIHEGEIIKINQKIKLNRLKN